MKYTKKYLQEYNQLEEDKQFVLKLIRYIVYTLIGEYLDSDLYVRMDMLGIEGKRVYVDTEDKGLEFLNILELSFIEYGDKRIDVNLVLGQKVLEQDLDIFKQKLLKVIQDWQLRLDVKNCVINMSLKIECGGFAYFGILYVLAYRGLELNGIDIIDKPYYFLINFDKLTLKDQLAYTSECREVGFDIALFGRMSTINILTNVEAALSVSHALSTNKVQQEDDFFIALDDFLESGIIKDDKGDTKKGAGHMSETSYDSCCYYTYYSIDLDLLVHNLKNYNTDGDKCLAIFKDDLRLLLKAIFETTPTGKSKGFASIGVKPSYMIFERISDKRPVNYINAFEKPVTCSADKGLVECSIERLNTFVDDMDGYAGFKGDRVTCSPGLIGEGKISAIKTSTTYANVDEAIESILATIK